MYSRDNLKNGFTITELIVVIVVIGILAAISYVSYVGIQEKAHDVSVLSDLDVLDGLEADYQQDNGTAKAFYSGAETEVLSGFTTSEGNIIDVVIDGNEYCMRGYNLRGTKNSPINAYIKESSVGVCSGVSPSAAAVADYYEIAGLSDKWLQLSSGFYHNCGVSFSGAAYCWGLNDVFGANGNNSTADVLAPTLVDNTGVLSGKTILSISAGAGHACVLASDSQVYCWGENQTGDLGDSTITDRLTPVAVSTSGVLSGKTIKSLSMDYDQGCVIASDDQVYCWGRGEYGQLGNGVAGHSYIPVAVSTSGVVSCTTLTSVSVGRYNACALASDNKIYCWGRNNNGQLGNNSISTSLVPVAVNTSGALSGKNIRTIESGNYYTCAIDYDGKAYCWGYNGYGQLGDNSAFVESHVPVEVYTGGVLNGKKIKSISAGGAHTCVVASDDKAYCWGNDDNGQLGDNSTSNKAYPVVVNTAGVLSGKTISQVSVGTWNSCALDSLGAIYCWGYNTNGQLGDGTTNYSHVPVSISQIP